MNIEMKVKRLIHPEPCKCPVVPGSGSIDSPMEERTEYCASDGLWNVGLLACCDEHFRRFCAQTRIDYAKVVKGILDSGFPGPIPLPEEEKPWAERHRDLDHIARVPTQPKEAATG